MKIKTLFLWNLPLLLAMGGLQAGSASVDSVPLQNWPTECVGRMQLQFPGTVYTAAFSFKKMREYIKEPGLISGLTFPDGTEAPFAYGFIVSHPLGEAEKETLRSAVLEQKKRVISNNKQRKREGREFVEITDLPTPRFDSKSMVGWSANNTRVAIYHSVGDSMTKWSEYLSDAEVIIKARPRPIFDVPKEPGLCLPYIFVPDDGKARRGLSMSYRLKDHPDIQVTLTDVSAFKPQNLNASGEMDAAEVKLRNKNAEPDAEIGYFWLERLNAAKKYESQWLLPPFTRPVTLAGYEGRQSFVRLTMDDGTLNYGYFAVVRGKPDATEDTPDLRLYVRQDVRQAQGKTPLSKEQFIEMAQTIAKSVQRRPTVAN